MRIIDKNTDFYDYLQSPTDTLVFDRRNSFLLTKQMVCDRLTWISRDDFGNRFLLLQCGSTFWLFLLTITETEKTFASVVVPQNYSLELLTTWKNYDKPRKIIEFQQISFANSAVFTRFSRNNNTYNNIKASVDTFQYAIDHNEHKVLNSLSSDTIYTDHKGNWTKRNVDIPILKACGISEFIDATTMFCAIEEYFSMEKTALETTDAKGITDNDKVVMHGFDVKTSFRGKQ